MIESVKPKLQFLSFYLLLLVFICLTISLGAVTWNIQNSCHPMIGIAPDDCIIEPISKTDDYKADNCKTDDCKTDDCEPKGKDWTPDIVGGLAGAATITGLAILEAPALAVVAAGIGVWFLVRTTIKAISCS